MFRWVCLTSDGGVFFTSNVHVKCAVGYVHHRKESKDQATAAGVSVEDFVKAACTRLCE